MIPEPRPPKQYHHYNYLIPLPLWERVREMAYVERTSIAAILNEALTVFLTREDERKSND